MESEWSNGKPANRCRYGRTTASRRGGPGQLKHAYIREDRILPHLPAVHLLLSEPAGGQQRRAPAAASTSGIRPVPRVIGYLRERQITLTYDPASGTLDTGTA